MAENNIQKKTILIAVVALVVAIVAVAALRRKAPIVPIVSVTREDVNADITSNGKVEPVSPSVSRAEFATFVDKVMATEGQAVKRGQVILTLDAADVRSQLAQARSTLLAAQTDLRHARAGGTDDAVVQLQADLEAAEVQAANIEHNEKVLQALVAKNAATPDELAQAETNMARVKAILETLKARKGEIAEQGSVSVEGATYRVNQAQEQVLSLEEKVRSATVVASSDGTLYSLPVKLNDYVKVGDTLAEMADLRQVRVRAFVDEPDLGVLAPRQDVQVTWDAKPDRTWTGLTEQVPKQVVARGMRSVGEVLCSVNNDRLELLPNINVQVRILVRERRGVLVVPREAVREDGGQRYVFVIIGNKVQRDNITLGIASASKYEVVSGVKEGDRVALPGEQRLRDGMEVRAGEAN